MSTFEFTTGPMWGAMAVAHTVAEAKPRTRLVVSGRIASTEVEQLAGCPIFRCCIDDGTGTVFALFIGRTTMGGFSKGDGITIEGTVQRNGEELVVWNPLYRLASCAE